MRFQRISWWGSLGLAACLHGVAQGQAEDALDAASARVAPAAVAAPMPGLTSRATPTPAVRPVASDDDGMPFGVPAVTAERLAQWRGGTDTVSNDMKLNGVVAGNTAVNVATGANTITNGSFSNASGMPVAIQNSGANVLIQNATIINVQLQ